MSEYEESRNRHPSRTGRVYCVGPPMQLIPRMDDIARMSSDHMGFERLLKEYYEPILDADTYARLRMICGLGPLIEGEVTDG